VSRLGRSDRTAVGRWFWEIDRLLLLLVLVLICIGLVALRPLPGGGRRAYSDATVQIGSLIIQAPADLGLPSPCR